MYPGVISQSRLLMPQGFVDQPSVGIEILWMTELRLERPGLVKGA